MYSNTSIEPKMLQERTIGCSENETDLRDARSIKLAYRKDKVINNIFKIKSLLFL